MDNNEGKIAEHRKMLILSGNLSNFHTENLRMFPQVVFNNIDKFSVDFNFYRYNEAGDREVCAGRVSYDISFKESPETSEDELKKRGEALKFFVRSLFWQDTKVTITREGSEWI